MLTIKEHRNIVYARLSEQILIENKVFQIRGTRVDHLMTLLCDFLYEADLFETSVSDVTEQVGNTHPSLDNILEFAILLRIAKGKFPSKFDKGQIKEVIKELIQSQAYLNSAKGTILFLISGVDWLKDESEELNEELIKQTDYLIESKKYFAIPDVLVGCVVDHSTATILQQQMHLITLEAKNWPRGKVSKLILFLYRNNLDSKATIALLNLLEEKIS